MNMWAQVKVSSEAVGAVGESIIRKAKKLSLSVAHGGGPFSRLHSPDVTFRRVQERIYSAATRNNTYLDSYKPQCGILTIATSNALITRRLISSNTNYDKELKERNEARRRKREDREQKLFEAEAYLASLERGDNASKGSDFPPAIDIDSSGTTTVTTKPNLHDVEKTRQDEKWTKEENQVALHQLQQVQYKLAIEARAITLSFYRICLKCVKLLRTLNDHDIQHFEKREQEQLNSSSMQPPTDLEDEIRSRYAYYKEWTYENFQQEADCLPLSSAPTDGNGLNDKEYHTMEQQRDHALFTQWEVDDVQRYAYYMKLGETKRKWLLNDYHREDPFHDKFTYDILHDWECRAMEYVREVCKLRGWALPEEEKKDEEGEVVNGIVAISDAGDEDNETDWRTLRKENEVV